MDIGVYGCDGVLELNVVCVTEKTKAMMTDNVAKGEDVEDEEYEEERTKHGTLENTMSQRGYVGGACG